MPKFKILISLFLIMAISFSVIACSPVDKNYGVSKPAESVEDKNLKITEVDDIPIMSSDRVMSNYFDISLFDEENYSDIYLGKKFEIEAKFAGKSISVPCKLSDLENLGWHLSEGNTYGKDSLVFSYEEVGVIFENADGVKFTAHFFNSSKQAVFLSECNIVKFAIVNNFYNSPKGYHPFTINGISNTFAITDIINTLGTPSHFYAVSENCYYLDYFISKKDRRNGITVYINPKEDSIISIEFSYYK